MLRLCGKRAFRDMEAQVEEEYKKGPVARPLSRVARLLERKADCQTNDPSALEYLRHSVAAGER